MTLASIAQANGAVISQTYAMLRSQHIFGTTAVMEGWTELQFDIRATCKKLSNDIHTIVIKTWAGLVVGGCIFRGTAVCILLNRKIV